MDEADRRVSKKLSFWLRHRPDAAGLTLDPQGWAETRDVQRALAAAGVRGGAATLRRVVADNDKQRFELSGDGARIRARQGHSVEVELGWPETPPPDRLYHGTVAAALGSIRAQGLRPMRRHHVHLSPDVATATAVGARRGKPVVLTIDAAALAAAGQPFYLTANGVWLTEKVPPEHISGFGS